MVEHINPLRIMEAMFLGAIFVTVGRAANGVACLASEADVRELKICADDIGECPEKMLRSLKRDARETTDEGLKIHARERIQREVSREFPSIGFFCSCAASTCSEQPSTVQEEQSWPTNLHVRIPEADPDHMPPMV